MSIKRTETINSMTEDILSLYSIDIPIADMREAVRIIGGKVRENGFMNAYSDGVIKKDGNSFCVIIPYGISKTKENVMLAECLGQLFLYAGYMVNNDIWDKIRNGEQLKPVPVGQYGSISSFATAFLMPKDRFRHIVDDNMNGNAVNISMVAKYFNVSEDAVSYRGRDLGYWK